ncbi:MAG: FHA domain-containing protein [Verrucomicrobiota bacterium]|nr:FHA domain-containing protein [Verrucomicrobiota bacterium]
MDLEEVVIGRKNDSREIHLDLAPDESVSRVHARVLLEGGIIFIEDLGSSAGTFIDGIKIDTKIKLEPESKVKIGGAFLDFRINSSAQKVDEFQADNPPANNNPEELLSSHEGKNIHVKLNRNGEISQLSFALDELFVGRKHPEHEIHIDLNPDLKASRKHARIWRTRNICWIADLSSTHGTLVNGEILNGARVIEPNDVVQIGAATMQFYYEAGSGGAVASKRIDDESAFEELDTYPVYKEENYRYHLPGRRKKSDLDSIFKSRKSPVGRIRVTHELKLDECGKGIDDGSGLSSLFPEIINQLSELPDQHSLSEWFVTKVSNWMPEVNRASFFMADHSSGRINLLAHKPALKPVVSDMLAHRSWETNSAYAWEQVGKEESVRRLSANAGIYVPLIFMEKELGLICVESTAESGSFSMTHLSWLVLVGKVMSISLEGGVQKASG